MNKVKGFFRRRWKLTTTAIVIALLLALIGPIGIQINSPQQEVGSPSLEIGQHQIVLTIGTETYAAGTADYTCDGSDDDVQFQQALNALPVGGGKLVVLAGSYSFSAAVSRAIDNVTIQGAGRAAYLARDGVNPLFDVGSQSNWVFRDLRFDAGEVTVTSASYWVMENVWLGATYYALRTDSNITAASIDIPTGRGATFVVAASNASAASKAQADYVCDGTADNVEIQAAIDALTSGRTWIETVKLIGSFNMTTSILPDSYTKLDLSEAKLVAQTASMWVIRIVAKSNVIVEGGHIDLNTIADHGVKTDTATSVNIKILSVKVSNSPAAGAVSVGLGFSNAEDILVQGCSFDAIHNYAVAVNDCYRVKVESCHSYNGIGELAFNETTYDSLMVGNTIEVTEIDSIAIKLNVAKNCTITGNTLTASTKNNSTGISISATGCDDNVIANNIVRGFTVGIYPNYHPYRTIINGNNISDCTTGILESSGAEYSSVVDNIIDNCTTGIDFALYWGLMDSNRISNCTVGISLDTLSRVSSVVGNHISSCQQEAIKLYDGATVYNLSLIGNTILDAGVQTTNTYDAISLGGVYHIVVGNDIRSLNANRIRYGIAEQASGDYNDIAHNTVVNSASAKIYTQGSNTKVGNNLGYITENSGTGTILSGNTTLVVAHGLAAIPTVVSIAFREQGTNDFGRWWVDTIGATNFTLNVSADPGASNLDFAWEAKVR